MYTGKNPNFTAEFNCQEQTYFVYYKDKLIATKYKFSDIQSYLD